MPHIIPEHNIEWEDLVIKINSHMASYSRQKYLNTTNLK